MVIYDKLLINGSEFSSKFDMNVSSVMSENSSASTFNITIPNYQGIFSGLTAVGQDIAIYADQDVNPPTTKILAGFVSNLTYQGNTNNGKILITGRDYSSIMQDATIPPVIFRNIDAGSLLKTLIDQNTSGLFTGSIPVSTGQIIDVIRYNHIHVADAAKTIGDEIGYYNYVNSDKYVLFNPNDTTSASFTIGSHNTIRSNIRFTDQDMANEIYVYGDRVLNAAIPITNVSDGVGSVVQLIFKPFNTEVTFSGTTMVKGGVFNANSVPLSGLFYLTDQEKGQLIWTSGTDIGNNVPPSGTISTIKYDRMLPIVKYIRNQTSINQYHKRSKVITDKSIRDPLIATNIALAEIQNSTPKMQGTADLQGTFYSQPGQLVFTNLPNEGIGSESYQIVESNYKFTPETRLSEQVLSVKLNKKILDVTDTIKQMLIDIRKIQAGEMDESDILTNIEIGGGSMSFIMRQSLVTKREIGTSFIFGHWANGFLGSVPTLQPTLGNHETSSLKAVLNYQNTYTEDFSRTTFSGPGTAYWNTAGSRLAMTSLSTHFPTTSYHNIGSIYIDPSRTTSQVMVASEETRWNPTDIVEYYATTDVGNSYQQIYADAWSAVPPGSNLQIKVVFTGNGNKDTYVQSLVTSYN